MTVDHSPFPNSHVSGKRQSLTSHAMEELVAFPYAFLARVLLTGGEGLAGTGGSN